MSSKQVKQIIQLSVIALLGASQVSCAFLRDLRDATNTNLLQDQGETVKVTVSAYSLPSRTVDKSRNICFVKEAKKDASLEVKSQLYDFVNTCASIASLKGLNVVEHSKGSNCTAVNLGWYASEGESYYIGSSASCSTVYNSTFCSSNQHNVTYYGKGIQLDFVDPENSSTERVHSIRATLATRNPGFLNGTVIALCNAAFQDYPRKLNQLEYSASTSMPRKRDQIGH